MPVKFSFNFIADQNLEMQLTLEDFRGKNFLFVSILIFFHSLPLFDQMSHVTSMVPLIESETACFLIVRYNDDLTRCVIFAAGVITR